MTKQKKSLPLPQTCGNKTIPNFFVLSLIIFVAMNHKKWKIGKSREKSS